MKINIKSILLVLITMIISVTTTVTATLLIASENITYEDTTVKNALDDLYKNCNIDSGMKNIALYGAPYETITVMQDETVIGTYDLDSTGRAASDIKLNYGYYNFSGSISGYNVDKSINNLTEEIKVMPDNILYWYGKMEVPFDNPGEYRYSSYTTHGGAILNQNSFTLYHPGSHGHNFIGTTNTIDLKNFDYITFVYQQDGDIQTYDLDVSSILEDRYVFAYTENYQGGFWNVTFGITSTNTVKNAYPYSGIPQHDLDIKTTTYYAIYLK